LAGLAGKKFLIKNMFQLFFKMKNFSPSSSKYTSLYDVFNWEKPGQCTTRCLQLLGIRYWLWYNEAASSILLYHNNN